MTANQPHTGTTADTAPQSAVPEDPPLAIAQYLIMNAIFYGACLLILLLVRLTLAESRGLWYFFGLIMVSFTLVSIYDFAYDRLSRRATQE